MNILEFAKINNLDSSRTEVETIIQFLIKEYGYLLPQLNNLKQVTLADLDIDKITYNTIRVKTLQSEDLVRYQNNDIPIIVHKTSQYALIDGYHRLSLALKENKINIKAYIIM